MAALGDVPDVAGEPVAIPSKHGERPLDCQFQGRNRDSKSVDS
jgi:hypothetical protein